MAEYLIISGKSEVSVIDALAVAIDIDQHIPNAQVDITVHPTGAPIAAISQTPRQIIIADMKPPATPDLSTTPPITPTATSSGGWKNLMAVAQSATGKIVKSAVENFDHYKKLREELRLTQYDVVFDLAADPTAVMISRLARANKIVGFGDAESSPAKTLLYHESISVSDKLSRRARCRKLASQYLEYKIDNDNNWQWTVAPATSADKFILTCANLPEPFMNILTAAATPLRGDNDALSASDILSFAQSAICAVGSDITAEIAAAANTPTLFIGRRFDCPDNAQLIESPTELKTALDNILHNISQPPTNLSNASDSLTDNSPPPPANESKPDAATTNDNLSPSSSTLKIKK